MTQLTPLMLKQLEGSTHTVASATLYFEKSGSHRPATREGGEGYAIPVSQNGSRLMFKDYFLPSLERRQRIAFISALALHDILPTLEAAPRIALEGTLGVSFSTKVGIAGYLATRIEGETFGTLLADTRELPLETRLRLALQLCGTVRVLESNHITHGDLAMSNVVIAGLQTTTPVLKLIDFDGFYHPVVPKIPCSQTRGGRGFGQEGYRHRAYRAMDSTIAITSDRAAMAALAFEFVALTGDDAARLGRDTLLDQRDIDEGKPSASSEIISRWPEGWELVHRAFAAPRPELGPSPDEWREVLLRKQGQGQADIALLLMQRGHRDRIVHLIRQANSFQEIDTRLSWLTYARIGAGIELKGTPDSGAVFMSRDGQVSRFPGTVSITLARGDTVQWDEFTMSML